MITQQQRLVAVLEMAAEAERLQRYAVAENLYKRASVLATMTHGIQSAASVAVLWDIARVCNKQNHKTEAAFYFNRANAVGFSSHASQDSSAA